jgi:hypothetical protein
MQLTEFAAAFDQTDQLIVLNGARRLNIQAIAAPTTQDYRRATKVGECLTRTTNHVVQLVVVARTVLP